MGKSRRNAGSRKGTGRRSELVEAIVEARTDLLGLVMNAGFGVLGALLEEDRGQLCGERHARGEQRRAYRHGYDEGSLVLGGRRVKVRKPRARSLEGEEMTLPHWEAFKATDPLGERALEETLTLNRLGLDPEKALLKTLRSTNIIENLNGALKHTTRNVKHWRSGSMVLRWAVTALMEAENRFRRVRGYREIPMLNVALNAEVAAKLDKERLSA